MLVCFLGCASNQSQNDDLGSDSDNIESAGADQLADANTSSDTSAEQPQQAQDDFADFDNGANASSADQKTDVSSQDSSGTNTAPGDDSDLAIEDELSNTNQQNPPAQAAEAVPPAPVEDTQISPPPPEQTTEITPPPAPEPVPAPAAPEVAAMAPSASNAQAVEITDLKYQANDNGGTIVVQANGPLSYTTRANPDLKQFIVEVDNAHLPAKLTRSLNTKDIKGAIGTIDAYQNPGSNIARFVVQLREGVGNPTVQAEGNSLLIVSASGNMPSTPGEMQAQSGTQSFQNSADVNVNLNDDKILASQNLADFMAGNTKFYGKKISIETNNMDVREALKFITQESGVNMVISDEVKGTLSLKLRQVPWDQALVVVMKARKLGYTRQGNVLRIAPLADLKQEEEDAAKLATSRKNIEPMRVRMFPISYAKVDDLEKRVKDFLSEKGKAVGDPRTNSLVVTDHEDSLERVAKLVASLDIQPPQVLIEGKIVEANESFIRSVGVSWNTTGDPIKLGTGKRGPINMTPTFASNSGLTSGGNFNFNLNVGTLDFLGNLSEALSLSERDDKVKVISSPRILTLSNEKASISQVTEVPLRTITIQNNTSQVTYQFKPLTLKLEVTPQITADASVIMGVEVNRQFQGALVDATNQVFAVNTREAKTKVLVKNGQTAVIGGIYQSDATDSDQGVPGLKDLPLVGSLFSVNSKTKQKIELVIFLTPRILGQTETASAASTAKDL
jgi:type IV pilus assembly protein PilQ